MPFFQGSVAAIISLPSLKQLQRVRKERRSSHFYSGRDCIDGSLGRENSEEVWRRHCFVRRRCGSASGHDPGMIGPNGSGKSTLVNVLTGFYVPDGGTVRLGDRDITGKSTTSIAQAGVVRTFQTPRLFADLTVEENLMAGQFRRRPGSLLAAMFGTFRSGRINAAAASESASLAAAVGLGDLLKREANELAQGNQRLLEIARALSAQPSFLILDEPAAGLSHEDCMNLCTLLEELRESGLGILLIEHHMDVVMRVCDRITVLNRGAVMAEGTPEEIRANAAVQEAYLGGHSPLLAAAS